MIQSDSKLAQALAGGGWKICLFAPLGGLWNVFKELQSKTKHSVTALLLEDGISLKNVFINLFIGDLSGTFCNKIPLKYPALYIMIHLHS